MSEIAPGRYALLMCLSLLAVVFLTGNPVFAGGGVVSGDKQCTMHIDFYSARFTAYQPVTSANKEFCEDLPDTGPSLFVLDYLHASLKEVPVDFRIIRDVTGQGRFAKLEDVEVLGDIEPLTVFYHPPEIRPDGSYQVEYDFTDKGAYIGIVTAGHPSNGSTYAAVFPFTVGRANYGRWLLPVFILSGLAFFTWYKRRSKPGQGQNLAT